MDEKSPTNAAPRRRHPIVRLLGSTSFGIAILALIVAYASLGSALPPLRGALEMSELQVFEHWLFVVLIALFSAAVLVATLTRVKFKLINAGALLTHAGLLVLVAGTFWYFRNKVEGDVLLLSPRIEVWTIDGGRIADADFLAAEGEAAPVNIPAPGGPVSFEVIATTGRGMAPVAEATVRARIGETAPLLVTLTANAPAPTPAVGGLALRLTTFPPQRKFYDDNIPALYFRRRGDSALSFVEIEGLPLHRERYLPGEGLLEDTAGRVVHSKRTSPHLALSALRIPTGWLEPWRLPIKPSTPELPFEVEITGYVPYIGGLADALVSGGERENPIITFRLGRGTEAHELSLEALDPRRSLVELPGFHTPLEFRWVRDAEELAAAVRPLAGPSELSIELVDPPLKRQVAVSPQQIIALAGTPYELTVKALIPGWPLATQGYEGARSPVAWLVVNAGDKTYQRVVVERFPQLTQDITEEGARHAQASYDPNLVVQYRSCPQGRVVVFAGSDLPPMLVVFQPDGTVQRQALEFGQPQPVRVGEQEFEFTLTACERAGRWVTRPVIQPVELRRPWSGRGLSAIRLKLTGRGELAGWSETRWCRFSPYPRVGPAAAAIIGPVQPVSVRLPDGSTYELLYSRAEHDLGATLVPGRLRVNHLPGGQSVETWQSDFYVQPDGSYEPRAALVGTNETHVVGPWTLFQANAAPDDWSWTGLGVGNRRGMWTMLGGCVLITLGCLFAFYVKPILKRRARGAILPVEG